MDNHTELMTAMINLANTIQEGTAMATHALRRTKQSARSENGEGVGDDLNGVPRTLAAFLRVDPPSFNGSSNPIEAENWFKAVEHALQTQHVPNNQFVKYAAYQLAGEAQHWWQEECQFLQLQNMDVTWELFRTTFYKKYFLESVRKARELEFMQLKQSSMSVAKYTSKFEELCRFSSVCQGAPESYEGWKCEKYQVGLREDIMRVVAPIEIKRFSKLVNEARFIEEYIEKMTLTRDNRGGTSSRGRGKHFPPRGQILKRDGHDTQHRQGQRNFRRNNKAQPHLAKGDG
ncbi:uncharacterized protein LOC107611094 [Arachis ipaensis]|uniref:uncharacterized protein LOC107611094 n=1 Tax=Arachis ipaensis TaxID=130454 RepID=UPI0007AFAF07|nr:uncharacterized protein LOC107611094 [Arachis ipaensis]